MEMPQDVAQHLFEHGAVLIIAGVPVGTEFGIDLSSYTIGSEFRGVKMIPAGPHYIYTASQGKYGDLCSSRIGFCHYFRSQEILVREWDAEKEQLRIRVTKDPELEKQRIREHLQDLDRYLAPYDFESLGKWNQLTKYITEETIQKSTPDCGWIKTSADFESCTDAERPRGNNNSLNAQIAKRSSAFLSLQCEDEYLPHLKIVTSTMLKLTKLPERCPKNATPTEITVCYMDSIGAINTLMSLYSNSMAVIDEIQFAFILFVAGLSIDALAHWRKLLNLLSNSEQSVGKYREFYRKYLSVLKTQLPELPEELMQPTPQNTVYNDVRKLLINCSTDSSKLNQEADYLSLHLTSAIGWCFGDICVEDPDDMPVIVET